MTKPEMPKMVPQHLLVPVVLDGTIVHFANPRGLKYPRFYMLACRSVSRKSQSRSFAHVVFTRRWHDQRDEHRDVVLLPTAVNICMATVPTLHNADSCLQMGGLPLSYLT